MTLTASPIDQESYIVARKFLYFMAVLVVLAFAVLLILRIWSVELTRYAFVPQVAFQKVEPLSAGAYADRAMWISRPDIGVSDPAQWAPKGVARQQGKAVVFFIHPSSYLARAYWNAPVTEPDSARRADYFVNAMASAFNGQAQVWAPRYRQAAFGTFLTDKPEAQQALDTAYSDVLHAFDAFLAGVPKDAPIVLAGHSQGALHLMHLLKDRVAGKPLAARIVAAYPIGWPISVEHDLPAMGLPACADANQKGCILTWSSFAEPADPEMVLEAYRARPALDGKAKDTQAILCINPLTGRTGGSAPASDNLGTLRPDTKVASGEIIPKAVPARCDSKTGLLMLGDPPELGSYVLPGNNYHIYDIPLFWMNVRADVARRTQAWEVSKKP
jgi:hypothetical protein